MLKTIWKITGPIGLLTLLVLTGGDVTAGPADAQWKSEPYAAVELCHSVVQVGDSWLQDFDAGFYRSDGLEVGILAGTQLRRQRLSAEFLWRGRSGEHLPTRGMLRAATVSYNWPHACLKAGRGHFDWTPTQEASLLFSQHARPIDHLSFSFSNLSIGAPGSFSGESFLGSLDDPDRMIPNPWIWGMRLGWNYQDWFTISAQRSIMLAGDGRGEKLTIGDLWDIFLGRGENNSGGVGDELHHGDTNQLFAWQLELNPRTWIRRTLRIDDLALCVIYAGEDRFEGIAPMAPGRAYAIRLHPRPWLAFSFVDMGNRDDKNHWYWHKIYGDGYTYRGVTIGHPMGGEAASWRAALFLAPPGRREIYYCRLIRESRSEFWNPHEEAISIHDGGFKRIELGASVPMGDSRVYFVMGMTDTWGGDKQLDRLAAGFSRVGIELIGSRQSGQLDGATVWGLMP
jgi:Capsule assembly protein Wzi